MVRQASGQQPRYIPSIVLKAMWRNRPNIKSSRINTKAHHFRFQILSTVPSLLQQTIQIEIKLLLSVHYISGNVRGQNRLPHVSIMQQLGLVVHQLLTRLLCELQQRILHNGVHRASLLTISTEDAARQIDVVTRGTTQTVRTHFLAVKTLH